MSTPFPFTQGQTLTAAQMNAITTLPINDQTASYVALVGDVGKRIVMNVATANTVTINNSVFATGDTIFIANKGAGATTVTAGAGVTINTSGSLVIAQHGGGTLVATSASVFTFFSGGGATYGVATGGTSSSITVSSVNYTLLQFTSDGTLTVTKSGLFDVCLFNGGSGGGAAQNNRSGGGGGAAGVVQQTIFLETGSVVVDVGAGGIGQDDQYGRATTGFPSIVNQALGGSGGIGGGFNNAINGPASSGVTGGGGVSNGLTTGGTGISPFGFAGGNAVDNINSGSGAGGGAGAIGGNGSGGTGGAGGAGFDVSAFISGSALFKGGGGGGGGTTGGAGGSSVGGAGGGTSTAGSAGTANTGSGGGGAGSGTSFRAGGAGGSGIVYVRFKV